MGIINKEKFVKKRLFYPDHITILMWDAVSIIFLGYFLTFMPVFMVFNVEHIILDIIETIIDVFFIIDILINFNLTYINECGQYETNRKKIVIKYFKGYFCLDLFTSIPFGWIFKSVGMRQGSFNKILRVLKLPKLYSKLKFSNEYALSNALKYFKLGNMWRYKIKSKESVFNSIYLGILTGLILHLGACLFCYIGFHSSLIPKTWIY